MADNSCLIFGCVLDGQAGKMLDAEQLYLVREQSDRMKSYVEDLDLVRERALVVQEELANGVELKVPRFNGHL